MYIWFPYKTPDLSKFPYDIPSLSSFKGSLSDFEHLASAVQNMGIDHLMYLRLRPRRCPANGGDAGELSFLAPKVSVQRRLQHAFAGLSSKAAQEGLLDLLITQEILAGVFKYNFANAKDIPPVGDLQGF